MKENDYSKYVRFDHAAAQLPIATTTPPDFHEQHNDAQNKPCVSCHCFSSMSDGKMIEGCGCGCHRPLLKASKRNDFYEQARQLVDDLPDPDCDIPLAYLVEADARILEKRIASALAEAATLSGDEREMRGREYQAERINAWLDNPNRQPANLAFTAGSERWIAYRVEKLLDEAATQGQAAISSRD